MLFPDAGRERPELVHPHACGECPTRPNLSPSPRGSSPRVWGMRNVGATQFPIDTVHPHACGECYMVGVTIPWNSGSSPRVWGMLNHVQKIPQVLRFIPTRVGNAMISETRETIRPVHPHACGECSRNSSQTVSITGSSPRVWGMLEELQSDRLNYRFIPTRVGNALFNDLQGILESVHPHACGECRFDNLVGHVDDGSSPRVWGMLVKVSDTGGIKRFIPTRVGNAHASRSSPASIIGSSPRVWGMRPSFRGTPPSYRFIPTRVGNAPPPDSRGKRAPVHPHACGECLMSP